ncbi:hypothetical protein MHYP_G00081260 [Metynnis hypsauchen]
MKQQKIGQSIHPRPLSHPQISLRPITEHAVFSVFLQARSLRFLSTERRDKTQETKTWIKNGPGEPGEPRRDQDQEQHWRTKKS